jgi:chemotaxis protein CheX
VSAPSAYPLPAALDAGAAGELARSLLALRGQPLVLDASGVGRVGALGLQVLVSARRTWGRDGLALTIERRSEVFAAALARAGLEADFEGS